MSRNKEDRHPSALDMAKELREFLEGTKKREQAQVVVQRATKIELDIQELQDKIEELQKYLEENVVEGWAPIASKKTLWEKEEQSEQLRREIRQLEGEQEYLLRAAFTHVPNSWKALSQFGTTL